MTTSIHKKTPPLILLPPPLGKTLFTTVSCTTESRNADGKLSPCLKSFQQHQELMLGLQLDSFFFNFFVLENLL